MPGQIRMIISGAPSSHRGNNVSVHDKHHITPYLRIMIVISMILYLAESIWRMVSIVLFASPRSLICNPSTQKIHPPPVTKQEKRARRREEKLDFKLAAFISNWEFSACLHFSLGIFNAVLPRAHHEGQSLFIKSFNEGSIEHSKNVFPDLVKQISGVTLMFINSI